VSQNNDEINESSVIPAKAGISALPDDCRVGIGFDVHAFDTTRELKLGGVSVPGVPGLAGHSDADVVFHALMDAMLGALALGDIGKLFPDTDDKYLGADSSDLLREVLGLISERGYRVVNVDITVVAEKPKIAPIRDEIIESIANILGTENSAVSVKGTTTEKLGFTGRGEGIGAEAVALLKKK
jgi:2-C-methyl-D-erythritol 2,4-cyclodiphosphate synthase